MPWLPLSFLFFPPFFPFSRKHNTSTILNQTCLICYINAAPYQQGLLRSGKYSFIVNQIFRIRVLGYGVIFVMERFNPQCGISRLESGFNRTPMWVPNTNTEWKTKKNATPCIANKMFNYSLKKMVYYKSFLFVPCISFIYVDFMIFLQVIKYKIPMQIYQDKLLLDLILQSSLKVHILLLITHLYILPFWCQSQVVQTMHI